MPMPEEPEYDGLPPADFVFPTRPTDFEEKIEMMLLDLRHIADGDMVAYRTSHLLCTLQDAVKRNSERLSGNQRDRMLTAFAKARYHVLGLFALRGDAELASAGYDSIAGLIIWWAESPLDHAERPSHLFTDLHAYVRLLRNHCHNIALMEQVEERAHSRREKTIAEIYNKAVA